MSYISDVHYSVSELLVFISDVTFPSVSEIISVVSACLVG